MKPTAHINPRNTLHIDPLFMKMNNALNLIIISSFIIPPCFAALIFCKLYHSNNFAPFWKNVSGRLWKQLFLNSWIGKYYRKWEWGKCWRMVIKDSLTFWWYIHQVIEKPQKLDSECEFLVEIYLLYSDETMNIHSIKYWKLPWFQGWFSQFVLTLI